MAEEWTATLPGDNRDEIMSTPSIRADLANKVVYVDVSSAENFFTISKDAELTVEQNIAMIGWWLGVEVTYDEETEIYTADRGDDTFIYNATLEGSSVEDKDTSGKIYKNRSILDSIYAEENYKDDCSYFFIYFDEEAKFQGDADSTTYEVSKRLSLDDIEGTKTWTAKGIEFKLVEDWPEIG